MISILQHKMQKDYAGTHVKRDAHPKDLGLAKAVFKIEENIPSEAAHGIFSKPLTYHCLIRLSNSSGKIQSDKEKDFRGFAIKIVDVKGERFTGKEEQTQDFILMSYPIMPLGTVKLFHDAVFYSIKIHPLAFVLKLLLSGKKKVLRQFKDGKKNHTSSFDMQYWSTTPYQLGDTFVKYSIVPTSLYKSSLPIPLSDNYLSANNALHLKKQEASFDFLIQFFKDEVSTPIEDAGIEWEEKASPFVKVATILIPKQNMITEERKELVEVLSFSPANSLLAHQPLGPINRARVIIYDQLSAFRHQMNNQQTVEPTLHSYHKLI